MKELGSLQREVKRLERELGGLTLFAEDKAFVKGSFAFLPVFSRSIFAYISVRSREPSASPLLDLRGFTAC